MGPGPAPTKGGGSLLPYGLVVAGAILAGVLLLVAGASSLGRSALDGGPGRAPGALRSGGSREAAPEFTLARVGADGDVASADLQGQVVVLHFWATWCPPCRAEFPEFARWAEGESSREGVRVFAVTLDESAEAAMLWSVRNGGGLAVWQDTKRLAGALGVTAIPSTVLIDKQGRIAYFQEGAQDWSPLGVPRRVEDLRGE